MATAFVRARIDGELKGKAEAVLAELGLTISDAVRILLTRVAKDQALPLPMKVPNNRLIAAMKEGEAILKDKERKRYDNLDEMINDIEEENSHKQARKLTSVF